MTAITKIDTVIFDVGNLLYRWDLRCLFEKLIDDEQELRWFLANVVTPEWHFQHDAGRPLADMVPERIAQYPDYEGHIRAYAARFVETPRSVQEPSRQAGDQHHAENAIPA